MVSPLPNEGDGQTPTAFSFTDILNDRCPFYMAMGMTYDEFWYDESDKAVFYRKAHDLKNSHENQMAWLQGLYVYNAVIAASPTINALSKEHKPLPYLEEPLPLTEEERKAQEERAEAKAMADMKAAMTQWMVSQNEKFKGKGET